MPEHARAMGIGARYAKRLRAAARDRAYTASRDLALQGEQGGVGRGEHAVELPRHGGAPGGRDLRGDAGPGAAGRSARVRRLLPLRSLHPMNVPPESDSTECWAVLAGLARDTKRDPPRHDGQPDDVPPPQRVRQDRGDRRPDERRADRGRHGGGWFEQEHVAYGIPFPDARRRLDSWRSRSRSAPGSGGTASATATRAALQFKDAPGYPKPAQRPHPPIIIGGGGPKRTPALAARFADEFNVFGAPHLGLRR